MNYKAWVAKAAKPPMVLEDVDCRPMGGFKPPASAGSFQPPLVA